MKVGRIKRLRMVRAFWRALGDKEHNSVLVVAHECGYVRIASGTMSNEELKAMEADVPSEGGYDHGR